MPLATAQVALRRNYEARIWRSGSRAVWLDSLRILEFANLPKANYRIMIMVKNGLLKLGRYGKMLFPKAAV